jgi:uncharacterized protein involved in cysteine biosynthesis
MPPVHTADLEPRRGGPLQELGRGAGAFFGGVSFVVRTPRALGWAMVPAGVAVGVGVVLSALGIWGVVRLTATLVTGDGTLGTVARGMLGVLLGGVAVFAAVVVALAVAQPIARVALDRIATPLEGPRDPSERPLRASGLFDSLVVALSALGVTLPVVGALELFTVVAPEAAFLTEPLAFVVSALGLVWELFDHPFSRRGLGFFERLRWMKGSFFAVLGFAIAAQIFLLIPGIDLFLLPVGVAGATRLFAGGATSPQGARPRTPGSSSGG